MSEQALSTQAVVAQKAPLGVDVEAGKTYYWCVCGRSAVQPFCDGAHKTTALKPLAYVADKTAKLWFCGCKATKGQPLCDGSHKNL